MLVAIHQPNFFPWLGYFNKIARADVFCFLDDAQFAKTGGTWMNRVQLLINGKPSWLTAPVNRSYSGVRSVAETEFRGDTPWRQNVCKTLQSTYGRAPHFRAVFALLEPLVLNAAPKLADYNEHAVRQLALALGLEHCRLARSSDLRVDEQSTDRLVHLVQALGGTGYLCGGGAGGYQDDGKFAQAGIRLVYQNFQHPVYTQTPKAPFVPGMSVIDALMYCGVEGVRNFLRKEG
jgi:hypothetical protein